MRFVGFVGAWVVGAIVTVGACKHHEDGQSTGDNPPGPLDGGPVEDAGSALQAGDVFVPPLPGPVELPDGGCGAIAADAGSCTGTECACARHNCAFACAPDIADASVQCFQAPGCQATCGAGCTVNCAQAASCGARLGDHATVSCGQAACSAEVGSGSSVGCFQASSCTVTVGPDSTVDCRQATACAVTCQGSCQVDCRQGDCHVRCPAGASCGVTCFGGAPSTTCPDGTIVCDRAACPAG